jgi:GDPmannose 4,6-dehydratase
MLQQDTPDDYVIATGETRSIREFLDEAFKLVGITDWDSYIKIDPKFIRPAEVDVLRGDFSKAQNQLEWSPKTSFTDLVKIMVENDLDLLNKMY